MPPTGETPVPHSWRAPLRVADKQGSSSPLARSGNSNGGWTVSFFRKTLGRVGERAAARHLKSNGYRILARNYACPVGELDLVCYHDGAIVFVEVKTRQHDESAVPEENITHAKRRKLELTAKAWLAANREPDCAYRFDAVSVIVPADGETRVRHIVDAFEPVR